MIDRLSPAQKRSSGLTNCEVLGRLAQAAWEQVNEYANGTLGGTPVSSAFCGALTERLELTGEQVFTAEPSGSADGFRATLDRCPGLAKIWDAQMRGWGSFVLTFAEHARSFVRRSGRPGTRGGIVRLSCDLSDLHDHGRSVTRVQFRGGDVWFYKPRDGKREAAWRQFLEAINAAKFPLTFFLPELISCRDHCWMREVTDAPCRNGRERWRFCFRVGALLLLAHYLRAVDLHLANFVFHGEHPVLVDCETLLHPETAQPAESSIGESSLERTGMISLAGMRNPQALVRLAHWHHQQCAEEKRELSRGFRVMHDFLLCRDVKVKLRPALRELQTTPTRLIFRPTQFYANSFRAALNPQTLRRAQGPGQRLRALLSDGLCNPVTVRLEVEQLLRGDIPKFAGEAARARALTRVPRSLPNN